MKAILAACCAITSTLSVTTPAASQTNALIGEEIANFTRETDTFNLENNAGLLAGLQLGVERGTIRLYSLSVTFGNGRVRTVEPDRLLRPGAPPFKLSFSDKGRRIASVAATYRTLRRESKKRAIVSLRGITQTSNTYRPSQYSNAVTIDLREGRAAIRPSQESQPLRFLQIEVGRRDVFIRHITVTFANGDVKRFDLNRWVDEGKRTPRLRFDAPARRVRQVAIATRPSQSRDIARFTLHTQRLERPDRDTDRFASNDRRAPLGDGSRFGTVLPLDRGGAPRNHILLGTVQVVLGKPSIELSVNRGLGPITSLALRAGRRTVGIGKITAVNSNGKTDEIQVLRQLARNSVSPKISLQRSGKLRSIRIKATALTTQTSSLRVYAMLDQDNRQRALEIRRAKGEWIELGFARPPRFRTKTDVIAVGRSKGRLEAFRLVVEKHDVRFQGLRVVYGNGSEQEFPFYSKVNDGVTTNRFVLAREGRGRYVQKIIVRYNTTTNFKGRALVKFQGYRR